MNIIITAGPTREYIDSVRFITNASSGKMGYACAAAAVAAGHKVTLVTGAVPTPPPNGCEVVAFVTVDELKKTLDVRFGNCDALIMAAAVGDFTVERPSATKISRSSGSVRITLAPTEDILAGFGLRKRADQTIVAFAVEDVPTDRIEAKARDKMKSKNADYIVVNRPAAIAAEVSDACILAPDGIVLSWSRRTKTDLADEIIALVEKGDTE